MPRHTEEEQAEFETALRAVADEGPLSQAQLDALSVLEGPDFERFRAAWSGLSAGARARLIRALHGAALERLRLDFSAVNHLALGDPDAEVRLAGVESALEDQSAALLDRLVEVARRDPEPRVRRAAAEDLSRFALLGELGGLDEAAAGRVRACLLEMVGEEGEDAGVRRAALAAVGYFSDQAVTARLGDAFRDPELRLGAVRAMGRSADPRWTDRLMPVLGSQDAAMRREAARALGEIEDERAAGPLVELVDDPDLEVRLAVIDALGAIGGEQAREALLYLLNDRLDAVREAAERAISTLEEAEEDPLE